MSQKLSFKEILEKGTRKKQVKEPQEKVPISWIDIGVNLAGKQFHKLEKKVLDDAAKAGVNKIISISNSLNEARSNIYLCKKLGSTLKCTIGIHPHNAKKFTKSDEGLIRTLVSKNRDKVAAIGECGLDYNRNFSSKEKQKECFVAQIRLAEELGLPLYLHDRDASEDLIAILKECQYTGGGIVHCFTGTKKYLDEYLEMGFFIGITGWVCDERRGQGLAKLVPSIPLDKIMIETDSPWLKPRTLKGKDGKERWNYPKFLPEVAKKVAQCYGIAVEELSEHTIKNYEQLFYC